METANYRLAPTVMYYVIACTLAWIIILPLWFTDEGITHPAFVPLAAVMMLTPTVAAAIVGRVMYRKSWKELLGFLGMSIRQPYSKTLKWIGIALVIGIAIPFLSSFLAAALGWFHFDFVHFSMAQQMLPEGEGTAPGDGAGPTSSVVVLVATSLALIPLSALTNSLVAAGEEIGWRGYLQPALQHYGTWPALIITGALWGFWHAPLILLGYNFSRTNWVGIVVMTVGCAFLGILIGGTRIYSGNVWPAAIFHGSFNTAGMTLPFLSDANILPDRVYSSPLGFAGWIVITIMIAVFLVVQFITHKRTAMVPAQTQLSPS